MMKILQNYSLQGKMTLPDLILCCCCVVNEMRGGVLTGAGGTLLAAGVAAMWVWFSIQVVFLSSEGRFAAESFSIKQVIGKARRVPIVAANEMRTSSLNTI